MRELRASILECFCLLLVCAGCSAQSAPPSQPSTPQRTTGATPGAFDRTTAPPAPTSAPLTSGREQPSVAAKIPGPAWKQEVTGQIRSFALGKERIAALVAGEGARVSVWIREKGTWRETVFPDSLQPTGGQRDELRIFFGRDDWPRLMGTRFDGESASVLYLRYRNGWMRDRGEVTRLVSNPSGMLFGILGHDDPEVVCKVSEVCIIKRLSGWQFVPAGSQRLDVELSRGIAWGLAPKALYRMASSGWERVGGEAPWNDAAGVWAEKDDVMWVSESSKDRVHRWNGSAWESFPSPVAGPRGLWGDDHGIWLAGSGGIAKWDGSWHPVEAPDGPFGEVRGRAQQEVWIGGDAGLWSGAL